MATNTDYDVAGSDDRLNSWNTTITAALPMTHKRSKSADQGNQGVPFELLDGDVVND